MLNTIIIWTVYPLQFLIAVVLINVWIFRFSKTTKYRGAHSHTMREEFFAYGLPIWFMHVVGFLKLLIAFIMILTILIPSLAIPLGIPALIILSLLMSGAIVMHVKVKDSFTKTTPAILLFLVSMLTIYLMTLV